MKILDLRRVFLLLVTLAVLGVTFYVLHNVQTQRHTQGLLAAARESKIEGHLEQAGRCYVRYLALAPHDGEAMTELGLLLREVGEPEQSFVMLERAVKEQPQRIDLRRVLTELAIEMRCYSHARDHLEHVLVKSPDDVDSLDLMAECQQAMGDHAAAAETLRRAIEADPDHHALYRQIARLLRDHLDRPAEADQWMERLVVHFPHSAEAHRIRGEYLRSAGRIDEAAGDALVAVRLAPEDAETLVFAARCAVDQGQYEAAHQHAERAVQADPKTAAAYTTLADIEARLGRPDQVIRGLRRGLASVPEAGDLTWNLVRFLLDEHQLDEARAMAERLARLQYPKSLQSYVQARIAYEEGAWRIAREGFRVCRAELANHAELAGEVEYWLGMACGRLGNLDEQVAALRKAVAIDRFSLPARLALAESLAASGRLAEATAIHEETMQLQGAPARGWLLLAQWRLVEQQRRKPADRDWRTVDEALGQAALADSNAVELTIVCAEVLLARGEPVEAQELLSDACRKSPAKCRLWAARAALAQDLGQQSESDAILNQAERAAGDTPLLRVACARGVLLQHEREAAPRLRQLADPPEGFSAEEKMQLHRGLLDLTVRVDPRLAIDLCRGILSEEPTDLQTWLALLDLSIRLGDDRGVQEAVEAIAQVAGEGPVWHYAEAMRLIAASNSEGTFLDEAQIHLDQASLAYRDWPRLAIARAAIARRRGDLAEAIQRYRQAIDWGDRSPDTFRRAVVLLDHQGRFREAGELLRRLSADPARLSVDLARVRRSLSYRTHDFEAALETAELLAAGSSDAQDYAWLGHLLTSLAMRPARAADAAQSDATARRAERCFRKALQLDPREARASAGLARLLVGESRTQEAADLAHEACRQLTAEQFPVAAAEFNEILGQPEAAARQYQAAFEAAPHDPDTLRRVADFYLRTGRATQAETSLRSLVAACPAEDRQDLPWARRTLAMVLRQRGHYPELLEAIALVEANLATPLPADQDRRALAVLLASHPRREKRREARRVLAELIESQRAASPEDRLLLAQLWLAEGDWLQASRQLRTVAVSHGDQPRYIRPYVRALLEQEETIEAGMWLDRLERLAPNDFSTVSLRAEALARQHRYAEALRLLDECLADRAGGDDHTSSAMRAIAGRLGEFAARAEAAGENDRAAKLAAEAERLYAEYVRQHPEQELRFGRFLAKRGRVAEAVAIANKSWKDADPALLDAALVELLNHGHQLGDATVRFEKLLDAVLKHRERPPALLCGLANLRTSQERYSDAEALYREVLQEDPEHLAALNNLAILLALQGREVEEASQLVERAIQVAGPTAALLDTRATVRFAEGRFTQALADLDEAIGDQPTPVRLFHRAQVAYRLGRKTAAIDWKSARERGLDTTMLHPLERATYGQLIAALR